MKIGSVWNNKTWNDTAKPPHVAGMRSLISPMLFYWSKPDHHLTNIGYMVSLDRITTVQGSLSGMVVKLPVELDYFEA
jgi:hypothetical protein